MICLLRPSCCRCFWTLHFRLQESTTILQIYPAASRCKLNNVKHLNIHDCFYCLELHDYAIKDGLCNVTSVRGATPPTGPQIVELLGKFDISVFPARQLYTCLPHKSLLAQPLDIAHSTYYCLMCAHSLGYPR